MKHSIAKVLLGILLVTGFLVSCQNPLQESARGKEPEAKIERTIINGTTHIEAEAYGGMSGVQVEDCSEGGQSIGYIDAGDWLYYPITINTAGSYKISYRVASPNDAMSLSADIDAGATVLGTAIIPNTGDWQTWATVSHTVSLPTGTYNLGINAGTGGFNLNWFEIAPISVAATNPGASDGKAYFMIVNRNSSMALDLIGGSNENNARINQWTYDYNGPNQRWTLIPTEGGNHFKLASWVTGKVASIAGDSMENGAQLQQADYVPGNTAQQFDLVDAGNGWFKIRSVKSGKVLEVDAFGISNDTKVQQWDDVNGTNQMWRLQAWGDYYIRSVSSGRYVCVEGAGSSDGSRIIQYDGQNNPWFKWRFQSKNEGWTAVHSLNASSKVISVIASNTAAAASTHLWEYNPANVGDQKVKIIPQTNGTFRFVFAFTGMGWDLPYGQLGNYVPLQQYPDNGGAWQTFRLLRNLDTSGTVVVNPVNITTQPTSQKVLPGSTATFSVKASSSGTISYQWYKNGTAIAGATQSNYFSPVFSTSDTNATYYVNLTSQGSTVKSNTVNLTIVHDVDDLLARARGKSWSSSTPMGTHYQGRHVTTDSDRTWLLNAANQPPAPPGLVNSLRLKAFPITLYPNGKPSPADINQHAIGDCNGITALANLAYMVPDFVASRISDKGNNIYEIAMFDPQGQQIAVRVDNQLLADSSGRIACVTAKNDVACWSSLLEKAVMKYNVIYQVNTTIEGIGCEHVLPLFTGNGNSYAYDRNALSPAELTRVVKAALSTGKFISGGYGAQITWNNVYSVTAHGYACFWPADGVMIAMRNPWGVNPIINNGGYDGSLDGLLNLPPTTTWSGTIDLRITDCGIAGSAGRTTPYVPGPSLLQSVRLSPSVANPGRK